MVFCAPSWFQAVPNNDGEDVDQTDSERRWLHRIWGVLHRRHLHPTNSRMSYAHIHVYIYIYVCIHRLCTSCVQIYIHVYAHMCIYADRHRYVSTGMCLQLGIAQATCTQSFQKSSIKEYIPNHNYAEFPYDFWLVLKLKTSGALGLHCWSL